VNTACQNKAVTYIALIRGINVGGKNSVPMPALRACFERLGFTDVTTYIQSGNVVFKTGRASVATLGSRIDSAMEAEFGCGAPVVVLTAQKLRKLIENAPPGFGSRPELYRYDVAFLVPSLNAAEVVSTIRVREGVDSIWAGDGVFYFSRLIEQLTKTYMSKITQHPAYRRMTIRNWNTTTKLDALANES
jgi:uncharacterized protein (DUF1697 family)